ncbi:MAG: hypothetical protein HY909_16590 [Deltaproteobacteria bacterium]|nr:hypothetical protein [Deltaproteobacteria bacterium]
MDRPLSARHGLLALALLAGCTRTRLQCDPGYTAREDRCELDDAGDAGDAVSDLGDTPEEDAPEDTEDLDTKDVTDAMDAMDVTDATDATDATDTADTAPVDTTPPDTCAMNPDPVGDSLDQNCDGVDGLLDAQVYVDPAGGSDMSVGSAARPVASLRRAFELLGTERPTVLVRAATVPNTALELPDGVRLYGGYGADWRGRDGVTTLRGTPGGTVVSVRGARSGVLLSRFEVVALPSTNPGDSSIAMRVGDSGMVTLERVTLTAADGAPGASGASGANGRPADNGRSAAGLEGGAGGTVCVAGGRGGAGQYMIAGMLQTTGENGQPGMGNASATGGIGGIGRHFARPDNGGAGDNGTDGVPGNPPGRVGVFTLSMGYQPRAAMAGTAGTPGAGGGGGGGVNFGSTPGNANGGGGGGAGGCPGLGGSAGGAGGASVALLVSNTELTLENCTLQAGRGGAGGAGGAGGQGSNGGTPGNGAADAGSPLGGNGGGGGAGGNGGPGAGGAGGPSYALVRLEGARVTRRGGALMAQPGGASGAGGVTPGARMLTAPPGEAGPSGEQFPPLADGGT